MIVETSDWNGISYFAISFLKYNKIPRKINQNSKMLSSKSFPVFLHYLLLGVVMDRVPEIGLYSESAKKLDFYASSARLLIFFIFAKFWAYLMIFQSFAAHLRRAPLWKSIKWRKHLFNLPLNSLKTHCSIHGTSKTRNPGFGYTRTVTT